MIFKMSRSSYSINDKIGNNNGSLGNNCDQFLILEKSLEVNGQRWVENVNLIEDVLIQTVRKLGRDYPGLKSTFVVRRLPNFMVPFTNKNEYAVILDKFDFSLLPFDPKTKSSTDKAGKPNFGQIEIYLARKKLSDLQGRGPCPPVHTPTPTPPTPSPTTCLESEEVNDNANVFLSPNKTFYSHEVFKSFATAFIKVTQALNENDLQDNDGQDQLTSDHVQLLGPHLLKNLKSNPEVSKIFQLISQPSPRLASNLREKCKVTVNYLKSFISLKYEDTEVIIRPSLFYEHGYHRVNANLTERIPLYHSGMLTIGESLLKGCLLFPTSFETLWNLQFWPSESHVTCLFHPSSVILRIYKIFGAFCLNPEVFWECLNSNFMGSLEGFGGGLEDEEEDKGLSMDYLVSGFLYELEEFGGVEDWAPRNFGTRLVNLMRSGVDAFEKGFHCNYFTKINVLRGLWRGGEGVGGGEGDEKMAMRELELEDIRESPDNVEDYRDDLPRFLEGDDLEDEFGLRFDELDIHEEDRRSSSRSPPKLTSDFVYGSGNPFGDGMEMTPSRMPTASKGTARSLGNFLKKFGGSRASSEAGTVRGRGGGGSSSSPPNTVRSIADVASEFEKSIALQRSRPSLFPFPISDEGMSSKMNLFNPGGDEGLNLPGTSKSKSQQNYDNEAFEEGSNSGGRESIYFRILQSLRELPPSTSMDIATEDPEIHQHLEKMKKAMQSQEELVIAWGKVMGEFPKPKFICPHAFTTRQIQYLAKVIEVVSRCSPTTIKIVRSSKLPSWEISGDILRIVLHQMRSDNTRSGGYHLKDPKEPPTRRRSSIVQRTKSLMTSGPGVKLFKSFKRDGFSGGSDPCKVHEHDQRLRLNGGDADGGGGRPLGPEEEMQLALEDPETAATNRLLQWLWQLKTSEIGRLSLRANRYLEELYQVSMVNCHFLEQDSEERLFESLALRSAVAVTRIMEMGRFKAEVPLKAAMKKGWLWAEMVLSLASWNRDKGIRMKACVPVKNEVDGGGGGDVSYLMKDIGPDPEEEDEGGVVVGGVATGKNQKLPLEQEPDLDAVTLAFHSELATPIGWNDIEDPRQPGPFTVGILIFSSLGYYKLWEVLPGNLVHALVRLQKFNQSLQHVGNMLGHPHRKTALNEVRKLNKSTSFRITHFENNIMSKTFKRLASIRTTKTKKNQQNNQKSTNEYIPSSPSSLITCEEAGCNNSSAPINKTTMSLNNGREIECTKM